MNTTNLPDSVKSQIVSALQSFKPYKVILFGSYAYGEPHEDSDIDLLLVGHESGYKSFQERVELKMEILKKLEGLSQAIDILAYSKSEWEELVAKNSSFIREINKKGVLLEIAA